MAESSNKNEDITIDTVQPQSLDNALILVWLDDSAEEDQNVKAILQSIFNHVFIFNDPVACMELVSSIEMETICLSVLISGKYGQMFVPEYLQPLNQVKNIYVFCYDIVKHGQWAQTCDKVRCVLSDINKVIECIADDTQNTMEQPLVDDKQQQNPEHRERYTDDYNLFDRLALHLLLESPDDGTEDFINYCQTYNNDKINEENIQETYFKPEQTISEWYHPDLVFTHINSNNLTQLWTLRWFIRIFYRQLIHEHENFIQNKNTKCTVYHGTWLTIDELDGMKHRLGQIIIITELLLTYTNRQITLDSLNNTEKDQHKVIFEINIDTTVHHTIPYAELKTDEILLWFGGRYRLIKIEYIEPEDKLENAYWLIGLNLYPTFDLKSSNQTLYDYYLKELINLNNIHHAFGRILMYKGYYSQAQAWLAIDHHYYELTELAIRQSHYEQAEKYLEHLPKDSDQANLLRANLNILISHNNLSNARFILMKLFSDSDDLYIRAQANLTFGFINLILTQQFDQAFEHFTLANNVLQKLLPSIHPYIALSLIGIGYTYYAQNNIIDARKSFEQAYHIQKQSLIYNHPDFAKIRNARAHCLSTNKQTIEQALNESKYALNILFDTFLNEQKYHPEILATFKDIEKLKKGKKLLVRHNLLDYI